MNPSRTVLFIVIAGAMFVTGCSTSPRNSAQAKTIAADADATLASFNATDSSLQPLLDKAAGYAVFPNVGRAGWIVGGSFGRGKVFEGGQPIGWADVTQLSVGLQGGAQSVRQVLIFVTQERMDAFKRGGSFTLSADVSAVVLTAGAAATTNPSSGVIAIVQTRGGLMAQAAIGGERLRFTPNAGAAASARTPT